MSSLSATERFYTLKEIQIKSNQIKIIYIILYPLNTNVTIQLQIISELGQYTIMI